MPTYYLTTPIYYVNDKPHIGHAYTTLSCDVLARFKRLDGFEVKFLTGTDEHGQKVEKSAADRGMDPQLFTDEVSQNFRDLTAQLNFTNDDFIRTTETNPPAKRFGARWLMQVISILIAIKVGMPSGTKHITRKVRSLMAKPPLVRLWNGWRSRHISFGYQRFRTGCWTYMKVILILLDQNHALMRSKAL